MSEPHFDGAQIGSGFLESAEPTIDSNVPEKVKAAEPKSQDPLHVRFLLVSIRIAAGLLIRIWGFRRARTMGTESDDMEESQ